MSTDSTRKWEEIKRNPTYRDGALSDSEGHEIHWHRYAHSERSSQVFCVSALGSLRHLTDGQDILQELLTRAFADLRLTGPWKLCLEHTNRQLLTEFGGQASSIDVFCTSATSAICIESKFASDAADGFGTCKQFPNYCRGYHGPGSDRKTSQTASCRLEVPDGRRSKRSYWDIGRNYFRDTVFAEQVEGDACPFQGPNFQLMRNVLFSAESAARSGRSGWATLAIVPERVSGKVLRQVRTFQDTVLREEFRRHLGVAKYEELIELLRDSPFPESRRLGGFLEERIATIC